MKTLILRSGILEEDFELLEENDTLEDIYFLQWKPAAEIWILPVLKTPEKADDYWAQMDSMEVYNTREHKLLEPKLKELRRVVKSEVNRIKKERKRSNSRSERSGVHNKT